MVPNKTTVAIVGGGPVGLICSILLSLQGIEHVVFERQPDTSIHPKAVGLNQRSMEIFRKIGIEDEVLRVAAPASMSGRTAWYTSFGPTGREICSRSAWGGGTYQEAFEKASPCRYALLPQIRLEPILKRRALELNPNGILFGHQVDRVDEQQSHVVVQFHERAKGEDSTSMSLNATYCLSADGGRGVADQLGIGMSGESDLVDMVTAHIRCPISQYRPDPSIFLHWFIRPELGGSIKTGYLYHLGPYPMDPATEEWVFASARLPHEQASPFNESDMLERLHRTLQIPDLPVELLSFSHWHVNAKVAERYRSRGGRVFLVGDSAHRVPPWGALGLNSGIQDADNLIFKLALALKDPQTNYQGLLDSYDTERRPIGERVAKTSLFNMQAHALVLDQAIGLAPDQSEEENVLAMKKYFDPSDQREGEAKRQEVRKALDTLDVEFYAHGAEVGWFYDFDYDGDYKLMEGGQRNNPQLNQHGEMELCAYYPSTRPGNQLPHALLSETNTKAVKSTRELLSMDRLTILANSDDWKKVRHALVNTISVGGSNADYTAADERWAEVSSEITASGGLLVRPDGVIAFRFSDDSLLSQPDPDQELCGIIRRVLRLAA